MIRRIPAFLMALLLMAAFYIFAVMMEDEKTKRTDEFLVERVELPLTEVMEMESGDARALAEAFGAPIPVPDGALSGQVKNESYHARYARLVLLSGENARVTGIRPAAAAPHIMPPTLSFRASGQTLLGYELLQAKRDGGVVFAMITDDAAFLIEPQNPDDPGGFQLQEP